DLASSGQVSSHAGGSLYDQRSHVLALEGIHQLDANLRVGAKVAMRHGEYRLGRGTGPWLDSRAVLTALQLRLGLGHEWDALVEARRLDVAHSSERWGWLVGADRRVGDNLKIGAGYNFTRFSDDLTDLQQDHKGWFLNIAGYY